LLGEIGRGGVGVIYRARHRATGRLVALKMLSAGAHASATDLVRFRAEAQAIRQLRHPNIVPIYEVGEHQGMPYFAMEYMERGSLAQALGNAALPPRYAAELVEVLARAIQEAHDAGILHRDIKPSNILMTKPHAESDHETQPMVVRLLGVPKLTDFGIAKRIGDSGGVTRTGAILGTPAYMAPELVEGHSAQATTAVDVYALGAVLYESLTGKPAYEGTNALETLDRVRQRDPVPPDRLVPNLPPALVTICLKAMAREPSQRYPSARALADDLQRFLDDQPVTARREPGWRRVDRWIRRQPVVAALTMGVALCATLCIVLAVAALRLAGGWAAPSVEDPRIEYYSGVIRRWGSPEGVYRLSSDQIRRRELSFRFYRTGNRVEKVEAVDRHGRLTNRHSFTAYLERGDGDLAFRREVRWEYQYDERGALTRETALDRTGQVLWAFRYSTPTTGHYTDKRGFPRPRAGSGAAYVSFVFSENGLAKELRYLNANGKPRSDRNGIFGQRHNHDERGFVTGVSFLGAEDQQVLHPDGYAREVRRYDAQGHRLETAYLGQDALPVLGPEGFTRKTTTYDQNGNVIEVRTLGLDGGPTRRREGFAIERREYDDAGHLARILYLDGEEKPARDWYGVARIDMEHTADGQRRTERFFGTEGQPVRHRSLACTYLTRVYDEEGQETEVIAHDLDTSTPPRDFRFAPAAPHIRRKHDNSGNIIEESYFAADGRPTQSWFGVHKLLVSYTERGQRASVRFEDTAGKATVPMFVSPTDDTKRVGPSQLEWTWDESGNNTQVKALDPQGQPDDQWTFPLIPLLGPREAEIPLPPGVAQMECRYDERGNPIEVIHRGRDGTILPPTKSARGPASRGRLTLAYDEHGNLAEAALYGPDGKLARDIGLCRITALHDEDGRPLEYVLYGPTGRMAGPSNISRLRFSYDRQGNRTSESYFDINDRPIAGPSGYAEARFRYDLSGHLVESRFLDADGVAVTTRVVVERGGPGDAAMPESELKVGDILVRYAEETITNTMQLHEIKRREDPDRAPRPIEVLREGKLVEVKIPTGLTGSEGWWDVRRRWGRVGGGNPFWLLRFSPSGITPPFNLGNVRLRTEVVPAAPPAP
jgi:hypothetical protein